MNKEYNIKRYYETKNTEFKEQGGQMRNDKICRPLTEILWNPKISAEDVA